MKESERRNYTGVFNAFRRIAAEEGYAALYTGAVATMARAAAMNVSQLVSFDVCKDFTKR